MDAGWGLFGMNPWWPRLVGPLCALLNLLLTRRLASKLWPQQADIALKAPWILLATLLWTLFASSTMFDTLLTCCVLLGMLGLVEALYDSKVKGWTAFAIAIGLGILAKGPVIFLHLLPSALLVFHWAKPYGRFKASWFAYLMMAILAGCAFALAWALPAAIAGGEEYANAILWHQTADRTVGTKIHARSFPWYLYFLPLLVFPWITWPRLWQNMSHAGFARDIGLRLCATWFLGSLLLFSVLPSKQIHYLLPLLPAFALLCARLLNEEGPQPKLSQELVPSLLIAAAGLFLVFLPQIPGLAKLHWVQQVRPMWGLSVLAIALAASAVVFYQRRLQVMTLATAVVLSTFVGFIYFFQYTGLQYDLRPAALVLKAMNEQGTPTAYVGDYQGQLHYLGRLTQPLQTIEPRQVRVWAEQHPDGYLIYLEKTKPAQAYYIQPHREYWLVFRTAEQALHFKST
jgi:4-amino-4-deoxy-L-arabinose transferase-like glycosyltransferase